MSSLSQTYLFWKWLHIVAVIAWMAGILYLYRLFVYHSERGRTDRTVHDLMTLMEMRLYRYITIPAMLTAVTAGLAMVAVAPDLARTGWFTIKFLVVFGLIGATLYAGQIHKAGAAEPGSLPPSRNLRILNEVPTLLMLIITALVVFKPF
ncbi:MAG: protoporphyrinogen oxidase HemJ [Pseudomonadota bacterium]|jgi:putative membrane protein